MQTIAQGLKAQNIIDIGAGWGISALTFLEATKEWQGKVISIDINPITQYLKDYAINNGYADRWAYISMSSDEAAEFIKKSYNVKFEIIHIDGGHDYKQVRNDLENYMPLLSRDGYILMHDVEALGGPRAAFEEIKDKFMYHMIFPWNNGLGILYRKKDL